MGDPSSDSKSLRLEKHPLRVTLRDVARFAGVSTKTVSRVVNNQGEIREETRQRVQDAIDRLGYRPNILARSLVNQRTNTLAVVAWGIEYFGPSRVLVGIEKQANKLGYSLFLNLLPQPDDADPNQALDTLLAHRVDGIVWAVPEVGENHAWLEHDRLEELPPIVFLTTAPRPGIPTVSIDNHRGSRQATQHIIDQGRKKIGIITGPLDWWEARERFDGWKTALEQAKLANTPSFVVESEWSAAGGERAMRKLLAQEPDIDGVFASSDQIALGALRIMHELGRKIPRDIAIAGFDNIPESEYFWPPLTTVYQRLADVGCIAVQNLHNMIEARRHDQEPIEAGMTWIEPELIVRASTMRY